MALKLFRINHFSFGQIFRINANHEVREYPLKEK